MRVLIAGAGAIGGYIGGCLARAGEDVTLFARGAHLRAMQANGLRIRNADSEFVVHPRIISSLAECGPVDVIFLGVKAHSLTQLAPEIKPLIGENTTVISTQNGVPWWYFQFDSSEFAGMTLECVDPGGVIAASIDPRSIVGSIAYLSTEISEPGVIRNVEANRITLGEPDGSRSERTRKISEMLVKAGLRCPLTTHIRTEIWVKLMGNASFNPISAITRATIAGMLRDPDVRALVRSIMEEVEAVARKLGVEIPVTIDQRIAGAEKVGEHKTSMLQDLEAGRPLEIEPISGAVIEIARRLGVAVPNAQAVYACAKLLARNDARSK